MPASTNSSRGTSSIAFSTAWSTIPRRRSSSWKFILSFDGSSGGSTWRVFETAKHFGLTDDPTIRQVLADVYIHQKLAQYTNRRAAARLKAGQTPGPEGSLSKLMWTQNMKRVSDAMSRILGPKLIADTGEWGTYAWGEQVLGAPGYRIAGGSDEIQRNIIGERVLQLPLEPRVDKDISFAEAQRAARRT